MIADNSRLVSVIVPIYNVEPYLKQCVDSVRNQTMKEIEIILIDDGSPDNCPQMCDQFAAEDSRIRVVHQENMGVSAARNRGMEMATGDWIMFVDPDDWLECDAVEILYNIAASGDFGIVCATSYKNYQNKQIDEKIDHSEEGEHFIEGNWEFLLNRALASQCGKVRMANPCWKLYEKDCLLQNKCFFPIGQKYSEDTVFNLYTCIYTKKIYVVNVPVYHYRQRYTSACHTVRPDDYSRFHLEIWQFLEKYQIPNKFRYSYYHRVETDIFLSLKQYLTDVKSKKDFKTAVRLLQQFCSQSGNAEAIKAAPVMSIHTLKHKVFFWLIKRKMYFIGSLLCYVYDKFIKPRFKHEEDYLLYP